MSIEDQIHIIGIVIGWFIVAGYIWLVMRYFVKLINRKLIVGFPQDSLFRKRFAGFKQTVDRSHSYISFFLLAFMLVHFIIELIYWGFSITGVITFSLMLLQIFLGLYGTYVRKKKESPWLYAHRIVAVMLFVSIIIHVTTVIIMNSQQGK